MVVLVVHRCRWPCCWASCGRRWRGPCHQMEAVPVGRARGGPCRAVHRSRRGAVAMEGGARVRRGLGVGEARALRISASVLEGCLESWLWSVPRGLGVCLASSSKPHQTDAPPPPRTRGPRRARAGPEEQVRSQSSGTVLAIGRKAAGPCSGWVAAAASGGVAYVVQFAPISSECEYVSRLAPYRTRQRRGAKPRDRQGGAAQRRAQQEGRQPPKEPRAQQGADAHLLASRAVCADDGLAGW